MKPNPNESIADRACRESRLAEQRRGKRWVIVTFGPGPVKSIFDDFDEAYSEAVRFAHSSEGYYKNMRLVEVGYKDVNEVTIGNYPEYGKVIYSNR